MRGGDLGLLTENANLRWIYPVQGIHLPCRRPAFRIFLTMAGHNLAATTTVGEFPMIPAGIGAISASIAIPLGYRLLSKFFPSTMAAQTALSFDELKAKYEKWPYVMARVMVVVTGPLCVVFYYLFKAASYLCASLLPPAEVTFAPIVSAYWLAPAGLIAINCSGFVALWFVQWRLGSRYEEFLDYWARWSRMDPVKANKVVAGISFGLVTIAVFLGLGPYVQLRGDTLAVKGYFSPVEHRYPIAEIQNIRTSAHFIAHNGDVISRREYIVTFTGNRRWATDYIPTDPNEETKRSFVLMLSSRSGVPIQEVDLFKRGEL